MGIYHQAGFWGDPDGTTTLTKEDSIIHFAPYSLKVQTNGGDATPTYTVDAATLKRILGSHLRYSFWMNFPVGQANLNALALNLTATVTIPMRIASTPYKVGDAVDTAFSGGNHQYVCKVAGSSALGDPTAGWSTTDGTDIVDGGITWTCQPNIFSNNFMRYPIATLGTWYHCYTDIYVPNNATALAIPTEFLGKLIIPKQPVILPSPV